jgi:hypothetical protein
MSLTKHSIDIVGTISRRIGGSEPQPSTTDAVQNNAYYRRQAVNQALNLALLGVLTAGTAKAGLGFLNSFGTIEDERDAAKANKKTYVTVPDNMNKTAENLFEKLWKLPGKGIKAAIETYDNWGKPYFMNSMEDYGLYYPLAAAGAVGGSYAGWHGVKALTDELRKRKVKAEVEKARGEFKSLLNITEDDEEKTACAKMINKFEDMFEKCSWEPTKFDQVLEDLAKIPGGLNDLIPSDLQGAYLMAALPAAYLVGKAVYDNKLKRDPAYIKHTARSKINKLKALQPPKVEVITSAE